MKLFTFSYSTIAILLVGLFGAGNNLAIANPDPTEMVNQFERTSGKYEGFRRSGAKGICAMGEFVGSAEGKNISISSAFSGHVIPVIVRFSMGGANPKAADNTKSQRNLALQFNLPGNEVWQMGNISAPVLALRRRNSCLVACSLCRRTQPRRRLIQ
jgi:catalase